MVGFSWVILLYCVLLEVDMDGGFWKLRQFSRGKWAREENNALSWLIGWLIDGLCRDITALKQPIEDQEKEAGVLGNH